MGPRSGYQSKETIPTHDPFKMIYCYDPELLWKPAHTIHEKCQNGNQCRGPGCRIETGKTGKKRG